MTRARNNLLNVLPLLVSTGLALVVTEFGLRVTGLAPGPPRHYQIPDPVLGWKLRSSTRWARTNRADLVTNSHGWHDVEHDYEKPEGVIRIAVLGDSFMFGGVLENIRDLFSRKLEERILAQKPVSAGEVEIMNFGIAGFGTYQEYLVFEREVTKYDVDIVLLGFFLQNDLHNNSMRYSEMVQGDTLNNYGRPYLAPDAGRTAGGWYRRTMSAPW